MGRKRMLFTLLMLEPLSFFACARGPFESLMGNWGHMSGYGYGGRFTWLIILFLAGVVVYFLFKALKSKISNDSILETPLDILKKRHAKGEIDKEEFDRKKRDLDP